MSNKYFIEQLQKHYSSRSLVPFIGAGLSNPFSIPDWGKLIRDCALDFAAGNINEKSLFEMVDKHLEKYEYWEAVRVIKNHLNRSDADIQSYISDLIKKNVKYNIDDKLHNYKDLAMYDFDIYLTTNYDHILYKYLESNVIPKNLKDFNDNTQTLFTQTENKKILHLHGNITDESSIVISEEKYMELYSNDKYNKLFSLFTGVKTFLFIGFSFNDIFIQKIIKDNNVVFNSKHYIVLSSPTDENIRWLKEQYNLETISYNEANSSHSNEIRKILNDICENKSAELQSIKPNKNNSSEINSLYNLPPKNLLFTGRNDILKTIQNKLKESSVFIINGIAGIGKTQIAKQYAYCYEGEYTDIYWINAESKARLFREYRALASYLKLNLSNDEAVVIENIKKFFEDKEKNLIIYDNADEIDLDELRMFFPRKGAEIIVTTKNLSWDLEKINSKNIDYFTECEAREFLFSNSNARRRETGEEEHCTSLAKELMYYPLALEQARAYINNKKISFADYISLFKEYRFKLMGKKALDYSHTVLTTFKISFDKLREKDNRSIELLALCAFLNHDNIPIYKLFLDSKQFDLIELDNVIDSLMSYSLLEIKNEFAYTHGIIQEMMRNELEQNQQTQQYVDRAAKAILDVLPDVAATQENIDTAAQIIGHAITVYGYLNIIENSGDLKAEIAMRIGMRLYDFGQYKSSLPYLQAYVECYRNNKADKIGVYGIVSERLGLTYHRVGESEKALEVLFEAENNIQNTNSIYSLAVILRSIGIIYKDKGRNDLALKYHQRALELAVSLKDTSLLVSQLLNIGIVYKNAGDYPNADLIYDKAEEILNDHDEPVLKAKLYGNRGFLKRQLGKNEDALKYFNKVLELFKNLHDEASTAKTLDHIGSTYISLGLEKNDVRIIKEALKYYAEALRICITNGDKWAEANTLLNIGRYYYHTSNKPKAIEYFEEARILSKKIGHRQAEEICYSYLQRIKY